MLRPVMIFVCSLALASVASAQSDPLVGRMEGDTYVSPGGDFRIRAPVLPELGGRITDTETIVTFQDDFNTHVSIACFELDATQRWERDTRGLRDYLLYFFTDFVMANFQARFPGSRIESARFVPELMEGALMGYALLPGGSNFSEKNSVLATPADVPAVAKRGTLLFIRHRRVYVVSTELAERVTQRSTYQLTEAQENEQLAGRLAALAARITFPADKPRSP